MRRLVYLLGRYGEAIEMDLWERQRDLAEMWRSRRWRLLLSVIDHLPRASHYVEALADDEDLARRTADTEPEAKPRARMSEWTAEREALADISDRLTDVIRAIVASTGNKPPNIPRSVRPVTAADRIRREHSKARHLSLVERLLPNRGA